jgi:hypothetical protein
MKSTLTLLTSLLMAPLAALNALRAAEPARPNVLIFLADDLGYAGVGVNGCKDIPTPQIDSIAKNGVRGIGRTSCVFRRTRDTAGTDNGASVKFRGGPKGLGAGSAGVF